MRISKIIEGDVVFCFKKNETKMELIEGIVLEIIKEKPDRVCYRRYKLKFLNGSRKGEESIFLFDFMDKEKSRILKEFKYYLKQRILILKFQIENYPNKKEYSLWKELLEYHEDLLNGCKK